MYNVFIQDFARLHDNYNIIFIDHQNKVNRDISVGDWFALSNRSIDNIDNNMIFEFQSVIHSRLTVRHRIAKDM